MEKNKKILAKTFACADASAGRYNNLLEKVIEILGQARTKVVREINKVQVLSYWEIGGEIVEFEQKGKLRADYGEELLKKLSADMTAKFGRGFSRSNLQNMRLFYLTYPKCQTVSGKSLESPKSETLSRRFPIRQTLSDESVKKRKFETSSRKSSIQQTLSAKSSEAQKSQIPSGKFEPMLSWSQYCELLKVDEPLSRSFYEKEAIQNNWSVRELKRV